RAAPAGSTPRPAAAGPRSAILANCPRSAADPSAFLPTTALNGGASRRCYLPAMGRHWFPLALLGFLNLAYAAVAWWSAPGLPRRYADYVGLGSEPQGWFSYDATATQFVVRAHDQDYLAGLGWLSILALALIGTVVWYAVAARKAGKPY